MAYGQIHSEIRHLKRKLGEANPTDSLAMVTIINDMLDLMANMTEKEEREFYPNM